MGSPSDATADRILCIHPDGRINVFATNLHAVFGLQYIDGKVYVHHTPKFSVFDDDHGVGINRKDLIASDNPHPWLPSFNDHIPSGFHLAMDGYFYITTGDKGILGAVGTDGRKLEMRGGIYRMRPDGSGLEIYTTGTRNHLDPAITAEDEIFTYDNTDDGGGWWTRLTHMVDGGYYGYPFDFKPQRPYTLWMMTDWGGRTGAPTGACAYNEDALPADFHNNLFLCDWSDRIIIRVRIKRAGATYEVASRYTRFETEPGYDTNKWMQTVENCYNTANYFDWVRPGNLPTFKPVGITVTPDGMGFYVTDWGLNGWKTGEVLGRIWKLTYTGKSQAAKKPDWYVPAAMGQDFSASTSQLVRALSHPSYSVRMVAQRRLADRKNAAQKKLASLLKSAKAPSYAKWSAIWALDAIDGGAKEHEAILAALNDPDPSVAAQAARELGTRGAADAVDPLITMLDGTNEVLRFRAATALGRIGDPQAIQPLRLALDDKDLFARYSAFKALNRIGQSDPEAWPQVVQGFDSSDPRIREGTFFATRETYDAGLVRALAKYLALPNLPSEMRIDVLNFVSGLYYKTPPWNGDWWSTMPVNGPPPAKTVAWEGSPLIASIMRDALQDQQSAIRQIAFDWVRASHDPNAAILLRKMYDHETDVSMRAAIIRALPPKNDPDSRAIIGPILGSAQSPLILLEAAVEFAQKMPGIEWNNDLIRLGEHPPNASMQAQLFQFFGDKKLDQTVPLLGRNLTNSDVVVRRASASALTKIGGDGAIEEFLGVLDNSSVAIRKEAIDALGALKAKKAVPALVKYSTNGPLTVDATQALTKMPDMAALDIYLDGLASKNAALRSECRTAVTALRDTALSRINERLTSTNGLPDETVATLRKIYMGDKDARKGPLFKVQVKVIPVAEYQSFALTNNGDAWRGQKVFTDVNGANCVRCHTINGSGGHVGPDLTGIALKQDRGQIIESVLYPSKVILDGYQQVFFYMTDGDDYSGIIHLETTDTVTVIDSLGATNILQKKNIEKRKTSQISLMPEGLQAGLTKQDFSDLISYVENPRAAKPPKNIPDETSAQPIAAQPERPVKTVPKDPMAFLDLPPLPLQTPGAPPTNRPPPGVRRPRGSQRLHPPSQPEAPPMPSDAAPFPPDSAPQ